MLGFHIQSGGGVMLNVKARELLYSDLGEDRSSKGKRQICHAITPSSIRIVNHEGCRLLLLSHISDFNLVQLKHVYIKSHRKYPTDAQDQEIKHELFNKKNHFPLQLITL